MSKTFYIADPHFDHANVIKLCNRPFKNVDEMNEAIIDNWNKVVTNKDNVYIVGDFAFAKRAYEVPSIIDIAKRLKGQKHLIIGNHDRRALRNPDFSSQFKSIQDYLEIRDGDTRVILFHYPIAEWNGFFGNSVHIHGHVHSSTNPNAPEMTNRYNAGVDLNNFRPVTLKQLIAD